MLTIISVSYKSKAFLEMNHKLVQALNPGIPFEWTVVQNTPDSELDQDLAMNHSHFKMIKGSILTEKERKCSFYRSIHHAKALNLALSYTKAELILILDPDCFILVKNWINIAIEHMKKEGLVFFGVPYHPKYFTHYRDFPNAICMFINRRLMQEQNYFSLDFLPIFEGEKLSNHSILNAIYHQRNQLKFFLQLLSPIRKLFHFFFRAFRFIIRRSITSSLYNYCSENLTKCINKFSAFLNVRLDVGSCRDTGYKLYHLYKPILKFQTLQVFAVDERLFSTRILDSVLPDRYRIFPRNTSYIRNQPSPLLSEFGSYGEQFFWGDTLFGFHLKGVQDSLSDEIKASMKEKALSAIEKFYWDRFMQ